MKRSNFLKTLFALPVATKVLSEIKNNPHHHKIEGGDSSYDPSYNLYGDCSHAHSIEWPPYHPNCRCSTVPIT